MPDLNLLFLYTDQQRYDTLAACGNTRIEMPNLNRLARFSTVFERAYVTQPVCTPSRCSLLTGLYPHTSGCTRNNVPLRPDTPCLPEMVGGSGYATAYFGKWHLGDEIFPQHGFQEWRAIEDGYRRRYGPGRDPDARSHYHHWLTENGFKPADGSAFTRREAARLPEKFGKPAFLAREAARFIREHRRAPFILYVNFLEPHNPMFGPRDGQYDRAAVPLPPNFNHPPGPDSPLKARLYHKLFAEIGDDGPLRTEADWRDLIARYWGLCSLVDTHVGVILATLEECGLMDSTLIVFTSDHGDMMGSHQLAAKTLMYEESVRVPLLVRLPGQAEQRRVREPVSQIDIVPTLLDLMGRPVPGHVQGRSLRSALQGGAQPPEDVVIQWNGADGSLSNRLDRDFDAVPAREVASAAADPVRTVVAPDGWKFSCSPRGEHGLYNLADDPYETANLARRPDLRPFMRRLRARLARWQERRGDAVALPEC